METFEVILWLAFWAPFALIVYVLVTGVKF